MLKNFYKYCALSLSVMSALALNPVIANADVLPENSTGLEVANSIENESIAPKWSISKGELRDNFATVVKAGKAAGYTTASYFLDHSLNDSPSDLFYSASTSVAKQIQNSSEYSTILKSVSSTLKNVTGNSYSKSGSTTLRSTTDLHLAFNKVDYKVTATKSSNTWTVKIVFTDIYDFDDVPWLSYGSSLSSLAVNYINNYAALAQSMDAIVPFDISVTTSTTV